MSANDLLEASGLIDIDYLEDDIAFLMAEIDEEIGPFGQSRDEKPAGEQDRPEMG